MMQLNEVQTVHAFIYVARATKAFTKYCFRDPKSNYCDAVGAIYHQFGQEQGLTGSEALFWGMQNVELHEPTVQVLVQLNDEIFAELEPELRRDAILHAMTEMSHKIYVEKCNMDMYGSKH